MFDILHWCKMETVRPRQTHKSVWNQFTRWELSVTNERLEEKMNSVLRSWFTLKSMRWYGSLTFSMSTLYTEFHFHVQRLDHQYSLFWCIYLFFCHVANTSERAKWRDLPGRRSQHRRPRMRTTSMARREHLQMLLTCPSLLLRF